MQSFHEVHRQFLEAVEAFICASEMPPTRFGKLAAGDPGLVAGLRKGRACGPNVMDRVSAFMAENAGKKNAEIGRQPKGEAA